MKHTQTSSGVLKGKQPKKVKINGKGGKKEFFSRLSGGFMLPISVMSIAGLLLGIGAAIASNATAGGDVAKFGLFIKNIGDPIFGAMPLLFAAAIVIAFTDEAGVAVFAVIVGMLVFASMQSVFIDPTNGNGTILTAKAASNANNIKGYKILFTQ
jgi:PTS system glucose-specific IIC component